MKLNNIMTAFEKEGDFKHYFSFYIPVSTKVLLKKIVNHGYFKSENIAIKEAIDLLAQKYFKTETN